MVLARTLQFGYIQRLGGLPEIPLAERFFAGGASSQRAFPITRPGRATRETGFPLGGNALLFHSTELRFPLIGDNVGGVLFHDMGNVYSSIDQISFRFRQDSNQDFNYMVQAVGFGIRYKTPVGPIRVDFSYSPNSPRFVGFSGTRDQLLHCNPNLTTPARILLFAWACRSASMLFNSTSPWGRRSDEDHWLLLFWLATSASRAETLDRIAVTVGRHVISERDILQDMRISAFIDGKAPDFSGEQKRKAADRLVDQYLVLEDATATRVPLPPAARCRRDCWRPSRLVTPRIRNIARHSRRRRSREAELSEHLLAGLRMLRYTDLRFRPEVQISEEALRAYYNKLAPAAELRGEPRAISKSCSPISRPCRRSIAGWDDAQRDCNSCIARGVSSDTRAPSDGPDPDGGRDSAGDLRRRRVAGRAQRLVPRVSARSGLSRKSKRPPAGRVEVGNFSFKWETLTAKISPLGAAWHGAGIRDPAAARRIGQRGLARHFHAGAQSRSRLGNRGPTAAAHRDLSRWLE